MAEEEGGSPPPPPKPAGPSLLDQLSMMSNIAGGIVSENNAKGEEIKKAATRQRRKSRDLEQEVFGMHITDKDKLRKVFNEIDTDGSGELDTAELRSALEKCKPGEKISNVQVEKRLNKYDEDGNGTLSFEEYEKMLRSWEADEKEFEEYEIKLKSTFEQIDLDKSGSIDLKELMAALKMIDKSATEEQVNKRIAKYDSDKDGKVNLEEYEKLVYRWGKDEAEFNK